MSTKETHKQVNLVKNNVHYTCWIPSEGAIVGKVVELEETRFNEKGNSEKYFDGGWHVVSVGALELDSKFVNERSQDYKDFKARIK